jgi:thiamine-phosphate pyrophosphorylase
VLAPLSIYPIIDAAVCADRQVHPLSVAAAYLRGGARVMQLRHKAGDRADLAALAGAAGVHVGQEDLPVDDVRRLVGSTALVGLSAHTLDEIDAALASSASYVAVGPIFGTTTKDTGYGPRGLELVHYAAGRGKPVVAIGGITLARARQVMNAGASGVAVISDLLVTRDPEGRVRDYIHALG